MRWEFAYENMPRAFEISANPRKAVTAPTVQTDVRRRAAKLAGRVGCMRPVNTRIAVNPPQTRKAPYASRIDAVKSSAAIVGRA